MMVSKFDEMSPFLTSPGKSVLSRFGHVTLEGRE